MEAAPLLLSLNRGNVVRVSYLDSYEEEFKQLTGTVVMIDAYWELLQIGKIALDFSEIISIEILQRKPAEAS